MVTEPIKSESTWDPHDMADELATALDGEQFFLVYQPTIDLQTNAFAGVEALIRWRHPSRGVIAPDVFIPALESSGLITSVGRWTLQVACAQGALWHDKGYRFAVSVNISVTQFELESLSEDVSKALRTSGFDPAMLVLEFPQESLLTDDVSSRNRIDALKLLGVRIAIGNFRPSESSIAALEDLPLDVVKLNRTFTAQLMEASDSNSLVRELVELAKGRGIQIVASGIEDAEQRRRLQIDEVGVGQGYVFSRPHEAEEIDRFLEDYSIFSGKPL